MTQPRKRTRGLAVSVVLDEHLLAQVDREAEHDGLTRAAAIRRLLRRALGHEDATIPEHSVEQGMLAVTKERMARGGKGVPLSQVRGDVGPVTRRRWQDYEVIFDEGAEKDLAALTPNVGQRVLASLASLGQNPRPATSEEMKGDLRAVRSLRGGQWRATYAIDEKSSVVKVWSVDHRRDYHRGLKRGR